MEPRGIAEGFPVREIPEEKAPQILEKTFQEKVDQIASYLNLTSAEVEPCLRDPSRPACEVIWRLSQDTFRNMDEFTRWKMALELDLASLEVLCDVSWVMKRFCENETFWKAKVRKDLNARTKYTSHETETWKQNYLLAFTHSEEPLRDVYDLELRIVAQNHGIDPRNLTGWEITETLVERYPFYFLYRIRQSMRPLTVRIMFGDFSIKIEQDIHILNLSVLSIQALPPEIGDLSSLHILRVSINSLSTLPPEIGNLRVLKELDLSQNKIVRLPPEIALLSSLEELDLSGNQLTTLPPEIGFLRQLRTLWVFQNQQTLTSLPPEIGNLLSLQHMDAGNNELTELPPEIGNLSSLQTLNLAYNELTELPPEIGRLSSLQTLNLEGNSLTTLPSSLGNLSSLQILNLKDNPLRTLPTFENLPNLTIVV